MHGKLPNKIHFQVVQLVPMPNCSLATPKLRGRREDHSLVLYQRVLEIKVKRMRTLACISAVAITCVLSTHSYYCIGLGYEPYVGLREPCQN
jgi:hypothetical protein